MIELCGLLLKALLATIFVEEIVALLWPERSIRLAAVVLAANVATNPALNVAFIVCADWIYETPKREAAAICVGEAAVFCVETAVFWRWGRFSPKRAAFLAAALNVASYSTGLALNAIGYWQW